MRQTLQSLQSLQSLQTLQHCISLPDLVLAGAEGEPQLRPARQYKLYHQCPARLGSVPNLLCLEDQRHGHLGHLGHTNLQHQNWFMRSRHDQTEICPERKGIYLKKGKKSSSHCRDFCNKYEKKRSLSKLIKKAWLTPAHQNPLSLARLSKSETNLVSLYR